MRWSRKYFVVGGVVVALSAAGAGVAGATGAGAPDGDESEELATGPGADRARGAALKITHGGTANSVELDSENGATWEVEVTKPDGQTVDVRLDENLKLVVVESDSELPDDLR